ncbi:MAG: LPS export ABC transporter periplasmic protein LptC [Burkholderiaceae bacterium]|nr:LPS export ABC transporter periplasmic protein LptC [Burkholderiaceae bacterium]MCD8517429.1 LPS export ABC transporter periplasmic protein LptC [Burkholderiaceae bacterium]MCD8536965.1 LPS export ABC transporter periplasmic protein LptC [Burkholderiaceae bacterium]MCD8564957.1 LPS export ABC transporter periplasmic protein LptC [Burkholderiaceae bacterium]
MKDRFPTIASIVILVGLVIGTWFAAEYAQRAVQLDAAAKQTHEPDSWGKTMIMLRTNETGLPISRIEGDYMEHFPDDDSYDIVSPRAISIKPDQPTLVGTSRMATVLDDGNRVVMKKDAVVIRLASETTDPMNVSSEEITLLMDEDVAYTDLPAIAVRNRSTLKGIGMRYDNKTGELKVLDSTDVEIAPRARQEQPPATETQP